MLKRRIIPCLDVKADKVVKGVQFRNHEVVGDIEVLAKHYSSAGADELVFYDITASSDQRDLDISWINRVARVINIPFCVAGGIRTIERAEAILNAGADKISINSPAIENPELITTLAKRFGQQCIVVGIDSFAESNQYHVYQYTGDPTKSSRTKYLTRDWIKEVCRHGAGEIVLNCMNHDGMRQGYDIEQLNALTSELPIPIIASGGAGTIEDFYDVFSQTSIDGALAASVFHKNIMTIKQLKNYLNDKGVRMR